MEAGLGRINKEWHRAHPMPERRTDDDRIAWHLAHARNCGCREVPTGVLALMRERGLRHPIPANPS
jgi:hypothetical protein